MFPQVFFLTPRTVLFFGMLGGLFLFVFMSHITSLSFCGNDYPIPDGCEAKSKHQINCEDCVMSWSYVDGKMLQYMAEQAAQELEEGNYLSTKEIIPCYLLDTEVKAFKITKFISGNPSGCELIAYGMVNKHQVLVQLSVPHNIIVNENIPSGARQLISLN